LLHLGELVGGVKGRGPALADRRTDTFAQAVVEEVEAGGFVLGCRAVGYAFEAVELLKSLVTVPCGRGYLRREIRAASPITIAEQPTQVHVPVFGSSGLP
jgi:hypothetical protein